LGFLNSLLLFGLLGALVPLVIHLLERRKVPRLDFPSLRFLLELNRRQMRRLNLQRLLLLLLRMLLVALIAFALARPTLLGPLAKLFPEDAPRVVALAIDASASMSLETEDGTLAEIAARRARDILADMDESDEVLLYALAERAQDLGGGALPPSLARELLGGWRGGEGGAALRAGLGEVIAALEERPQPQKELYLLSDFAAATLDTAALPPAGGVRAFALPLSAAPPPNAGLTALRLPARPVLPGKAFDLRVRAEQQGEAAVEPFPVELELAGRHRGSIQMAPGAGKPAWRELNVSLEERGPVPGLWRKRRDRFPLDDELPFSLAVASRLSVLLIAPPEGDATAGGAEGRISLAGHLARALDPYRGARADDMSLHLETSPLQRLSSASLEGRHLVVLAGGEGLGETQAELLADFVAGGGGLVVGPAEDGLADLARHLMPRLGGPRSLMKAEGVTGRLAELDPTHPLFADFDEEHRRVLADQPLWRVFHCRSGDREALIRFRSGAPALLAWRHGAGRVRLLLFEAGPAGGELPYSSMFLPLVQELAQETAGTQQPVWAEVGEGLSWPLEARSEREEDLQVLAPGDRVLPLRVDASRFPPRAVLDRTDRAGFYRLQTRGGEPLGLAAVRVPPAEGKLAPLPPDSLPAALALPGLTVIAPDETLASALHAGRFGREIARPLLILAALVMALELWVAQREGAATRMS